MHASEPTSNNQQPASNVQGGNPSLDVAGAGSLKTVTSSRGGLKRKLTFAGIIAVANLPIMLLWWYLTVPGGNDAGRVPMLFLLLVVGLAVMVGIPCLVVRDLLRRRWILIAVLAFVNIFWCLEWITAYSQTWVGDPGYGRLRIAFLFLMAASSLSAILVYWICGKLLDRFRARHRKPRAVGRLHKSR